MISELVVGANGCGNSGRDQSERQSDSEQTVFQVRISFAMRADLGQPCNGCKVCVGRVTAKRKNCGGRVNRRKKNFQVVVWSENKPRDGTDVCENEARWKTMEKLV